MTNYAARLAQLERKVSKPRPVHFITKEFDCNSNSDAFDAYQAKRTLEGYTPDEGWDKLREAFLSGCDSTLFITFSILESVDPDNMKITNAKKLD